MKFSKRVASVLFSWFYYTMVLGAGVSPGYALNRFQHFLSTGEIQNLLRTMRDRYDQEGDKEFADFFDSMLELSDGSIDWLDQIGWRVMEMTAYPLFGTGKPNEH